MNRTDVAYLINTTPKYFYLLPLHLTLLQRYASTMNWPVFLATEATEAHPDIASLRKRFPKLHIIPLTQEQEGFLESRAAATSSLPSSIRYVFPIQEDFLLEARPMEAVFEAGLKLLDTSPQVASLRMMPCPGPRPEAKQWEKTPWRLLDFERDMVFTYQATLWRREAYQRFMEDLLKTVERMPGEKTAQKRREIAIQTNLAEINIGQMILLTQGHEHLAWPREGEQPNAVYLAPWPYRPTAVVRGKLMDWAADLAARERMSLRPTA